MAAANSDRVNSSALSACLVEEVPLLCRLIARELWRLKVDDLEKLLKGANDMAVGFTFVVIVG